MLRSAIEWFAGTSHNGFSVQQISGETTLSSGCQQIKAFDLVIKLFCYWPWFDRLPAHKMNKLLLFPIARNKFERWKLKHKFKYSGNFPCTNIVLDRLKDQLSSAAGKKETWQSVLQIILDGDKTWANQDIPFPIMKFTVSPSAHNKWGTLFPCIIMLLV